MSAPDTPVTDRAVPWTLHAVFWLVFFESVAEAAYVLLGDSYGPGGRVLVSSGFIAKIVFANMARKFSAGGVLGLLVFELVGILVALGADWAMALRLGLVALVVTVYALVFASLRAFPTPELPPTMTDPSSPTNGPDQEPGAAGSGTGAARPTAPSYPLRTKIVIVAVLAVAIGGFVLAGLRTSQDTDPGFTVSGVPGQQQSGTNGVEALFPRPDAEVLGQQRFGIDLAPGWTGELVLLPPSGAAIPIPEDELIRVTELDQIFYQPGDGKSVERLEGDRFCIAATIWDRVRGREGTERVESWCFNVV